MNVNVSVCVVKVVCTGLDLYLFSVPAKALDGSGDSLYSLLVAEPLVRLCR